LTSRFSERSTGASHGRSANDGRVSGDHQSEAALRFYTEILGFRLLSDDAYALAFDARVVRLRVVKATDFTPAHGTVLAR
jgi:hypothetical protein